jgi:hypothetical protein
MPPMTFDTRNNERVASFVGDNSEEDMDEDEVEDKLRSLHFKMPDHKVVNRLSRWEGGNTLDKELFNKHAPVEFGDKDRKQGSNSEAAAVDDHTVTFRDVVKVFQRDNTLLTVDDEDIERVKIMHDKFLESSQFNFNYNVMLGVASILAGKFHILKIHSKSSQPPRTPISYIVFFTSS